MKEVPEERVFKVEGDGVQLDADADEPYQYVSRDDVDDFSFLLKLNMELLKENTALRKQIEEQQHFLLAIKENNLKVTENLMIQMQWQEEIVRELDKMAEKFC